MTFLLTYLQKIYFEVCFKILICAHFITFFLVLKSYKYSFIILCNWILLLLKIIDLLLCRNNILSIKIIKVIIFT